MKIPGWKYYNHAAIPTTAPHETPDLAPLKDGSIWKIEGKKPLFARWTSDWDCGKDTGWWYIIKDRPFDISSLKKKHRYEVNKGLKNFEVKKINPNEYIDELYDIQIAALQSYSKKFSLEKKSFKKDAESWSSQVLQGKIVFYGAFHKESGCLAGYCFFIKRDKCYDFAVQKANPKFERLNVNAALVCGMLEDCCDALSNGYYISDGSRCINHDTKFQDFLEKNFEFRKAFCKLNVVYLSKMKVCVKILYPFRRVFDFVGRFLSEFHLISSVLKMEEIKRNDLV